MKEKRTYSLTAKERKAQRYAEQARSAAKSEKETAADVRAEQEQAMATSQKRSKRASIIMIVAVALAIALILTAVLVPVTLYIVNPYRDYKHVIAKFELSNEMVLEYVIEEDEYDIAATNFIFLAKNGYFDNTVLFDAGDPSRDTDGWMRFGGYEKQPSVWEGGSSVYNNTKHHAQNEKYCKNFKGISNKWFDNVCNKFGYDLNADNNGRKEERLDDIGILAFLYNDTSTEFQMSYKEQPSNYVSVINNSSTGTSYTIRELRPTMVGYALNDKTIKNLQKLANTAISTEKAATTSGVVWCPPDPTVYIRSVKVYNLDGKKWDDFDFVSYMTKPKKDGTTRYRGWTGKI